MKGARKAVLKIAGLSANDRSWLIQQLDDREKKLIDEAELEFSQSALPGNLAFDEIIDVIEQEEQAEKKFVAAKGFWSSKNEQASAARLDEMSVAVLAVLASSLDQASVERLERLLGDQRKEEVLDLLKGHEYSPGPAVIKTVEEFIYQLG